MSMNTCASLYLKIVFYTEYMKRVYKEQTFRTVSVDTICIQYKYILFFLGISVWLYQYFVSSSSFMFNIVYSHIHRRLGTY